MSKFLCERIGTYRVKNMAGACTTCKALRLNTTLKKCLSVRYFPPKLKYAVPAAFVSSVSLFDYQRSTDDRVFGSILWQKGRSVLEDLPVFCQGSRPFRTTALQRERGSRERGELKPGSGKIKAKLEQMKEMVRFF